MITKRGNSGLKKGELTIARESGAKDKNKPEGFPIHLRGKKAKLERGAGRNEATK